MSRYLLTALVLVPSLLGQPWATRGEAETASLWPTPVPCRVQPGTNQDLFLMGLGAVDTPLADGTFDPVKDEIKLKDGTVREHYFRDELGLRFYQPLDKTRFPLPPSGWCTWYYYYSRINAQEVKRNTDWLAANLKDFGAQYVQIDDGWQGGGGKEGIRDWTTVNQQAFPQGLGELAAYIKSRGLRPGLWLAPHGQSSDQVLRANPGVFLLKPDGTTASDTWEGKYLLDPTSPAAHTYLRELFTRLTHWGFDYFKIDGQPIVVDEYGAKQPFMAHPAEDAAALYRSTLQDIRQVIGPDRYLLGCWGTPTAGAGIFNGSRTGGDIVLGWRGFEVALQATFQYYYLHNIAWYSDPDVVLVRPPLTLDQARVWATLQGLTGQALLSSDRLTDLPAERVELLKRIYPAADIRPIDLFPAGRYKRVWDLKVEHLGRAYDVVGVFNFNQGTSEQVFLSWKELGLPSQGLVHVFDFWNQEYLGAWAEGMMLETAPTSCRVLTLLPANGHIQLISTSRHITQGWVDLARLSYNAAGDACTGVSQVVAADPYELRFAFPRGSNYVVKSVSAKTTAGPLPVTIRNHQGWAAVQWTSPQTTEVTWEVRFEPTDFYHYPTAAPGNLWAEHAGLEGVVLHWNEQYYLNAGYQVYLNGKLMGYTPNTTFALRHLDPRSACTVEVKSVWEDGRESAKGGELKFTLASLLPAELELDQLEPLHSNAHSRGIEAEDVLLQTPLVLGGCRYGRGLAAPANSEIEYELKGLYDSFAVLLGNDSSSPDNAVLEFSVLGDGKELWASGPLKKSDPPKLAKLSVAGVQRLVLRLRGQNSHAQGDWVEAKLLRAK